MEESSLSSVLCAIPKIFLNCVEGFKQVAILTEARELRQVTHVLIQVASEHRVLIHYPQHKLTQQVI